MIFLLICCVSTYLVLTVLPFLQGRNWWDIERCTWNTEVESCISNSIWAPLYDCRPVRGGEREWEDMHESIFGTYCLVCARKQTHGLWLPWALHFKFRTGKLFGGGRSSCWPNLLIFGYNSVAIKCEFTFEGFLLSPFLGLGLKPSQHGKPSGFDLSPQIGQIM